MNLGKVLNSLSRLSRDYCSMSDCRQVIADVKASDADDATKEEIIGVAQKCMDMMAKIEVMKTEIMTDAMAIVTKYNKPENIAASEDDDDDHRPW